MSQPSAPSDPSKTLARIEYGFARLQVLNWQVVGVDSKPSALQWARTFHDLWNELSERAVALGVDPTSDLDIQHTLDDRRSEVLPYITSEWVDLTPALLGRLLPLVRCLSRGYSLIDTYVTPDTATAASTVPTVPTAPTATTAPPVPPLTVPPTLPVSSSTSPAARPASGSTFSLLPSSSSTVRSSDAVRPQLTLRGPDVGPSCPLPNQPLLAPDSPTPPPSPAPQSLPPRPAKRAKGPCRDPPRIAIPKDCDLVPKKDLPRDYTSCDRCRDQKKRCAPLRTAKPPYDHCARCKLADVPCIRPSRDVPGPSSSSNPTRLPCRPTPPLCLNPVPSDSSSPPEYTPDEELIVSDGYPLKAPRLPTPAADSNLTLDLLALTTTANVATLGALKGLPAVRAAEAELKTLKVRFEAERAALRATQATVEMDLMRRHHAWKALERRLGGHVYREAHSWSTPVPSPSPFPRHRKGKGKRPASELDGDSDEPDDEGDVSGVERMLQ